MSTPHEPQDEPFNHETVAATSGHKRGESSTNLLPQESSESTKYDEHDTSYKDSFYDNAAPSKANLYDDPDYVAPRDVENVNRTSKYQDLGMSERVWLPLMVVDVIGIDYADDELYNASRAHPISEKATPLSRMFGGVGRTPMHQRIEEKRRGIGRQRYPFVGMYHPSEKGLCLTMSQYGHCPSLCLVSSSGSWS